MFYTMKKYSRSIKFDVTVLVLFYCYYYFQYQQPSSAVHARKRTVQTFVFLGNSYEEKEQDEKTHILELC